MAEAADASRCPLSQPEGPRLPCYCWRCNVEATLTREGATTQYYQCPKCSIAIRIDEDALFDPLPTPEDDSDKVSLHVSPPLSRRSTLSFLDYEENAEVTPPNDSRLLTAPPTPCAPANTPVAAPEARSTTTAFTDVASFFLDASTSRNLAKRPKVDSAEAFGFPTRCMEAQDPLTIIDKFAECHLSNIQGLDDTDTLSKKTVSEATPGDLSGSDVKVSNISQSGQSEWGICATAKTTASYSRGDSDACVPAIRPNFQKETDAVCVSDDHLERQGHSVMRFFAFHPEPHGETAASIFANRAEPLGDSVVCLSANHHKRQEKPVACVSDNHPEPREDFIVSVSAAHPESRATGEATMEKYSPSEDSKLELSSIARELQSNSKSCEHETSILTDDVKILHGHSSAFDRPTNKSCSDISPAGAARPPRFAENCLRTERKKSRIPAKLTLSVDINNTDNIVTPPLRAKDFEELKETSTPISPWETSLPKFKTCQNSSLEISEISIIKSTEKSSKAHLTMESLDGDIIIPTPEADVLTEPPAASQPIDIPVTAALNCEVLACPPVHDDGKAEDASSVSSKTSNSLAEEKSYCVVSLEMTPPLTYAETLLIEGMSLEHQSQNSETDKLNVAMCGTGIDTSSELIESTHGSGQLAVNYRISRSQTENTET